MGNDGGTEGAWRRGIKGRKEWDNCNSIINKIYLKKQALLGKFRPAAPN